MLLLLLLRVCIAARTLRCPPTAALAHELSSRGVGANAKDVLEFLRSRSGARVQGVQVSKPTAAAAAAPTAGDGSQSRADTRAAAAPSEDRR